KGWNGCMTVPRILTLGNDDTMRQRPIPELEKLHGEGRVNDNLSVAEEKAVEHVKGNALEIAATMKRRSGEEVGLRLGRSADGKKAVIIAFNGKRLHVAGLDVPYTPAFGGDVIGLHILLDHSVLEVYADSGRACITRILDAAPEDQAVSVFASG